MALLLNDIQPAEGAKKKKVRLGRGIGSGMGKTCGRGHKGFTARAGSGRKIGFEGGQTPLQRRLPKSGFKSRTTEYVSEIQLSALTKINSLEISLDLLKELRLVKNYIRHVKVIGKAELSKPIVLKNLRPTHGVRALIEAAGGKILEVEKEQVEKEQ